MSQLATGRMALVTIVVGSVISLGGVPSQIQNSCLGPSIKPMTQGVVARGGGTQQPRGRGGPISQRDVRFGGRGGSFNAAMV
jgi:hypothetical protein